MDFSFSEIYLEVALDHLEIFRQLDTEAGQSQATILTGSRPRQRLHLLLLLLLLMMMRVSSP